MTRNVCRKSLDAVLGWLVMGCLLVYGTVRRLVSPRHRTPPAQLEVKSILVSKLCCLGDGVLAVPAIRALKEHYPEATLTLICTPRSVEAFRGHDFIDRIVNLQVTGFGGMKEIVLSGPRVVREALSAVRGCRPDLAVDLDLYYKLTPVLGFLSGAPIRTGFDTKGKHRGCLFTHKVPRDPDRHEVLCFLDILEAVGIETDDEALCLWEDPEASAAAAEMLDGEGIAEGQRYGVLTPGSSNNWPVKRWAAEKFAAVGRHLVQEHEMRIVVLGAGFETELGQDVAENIGSGAVNLAGKTSVRETIEILRGAQIAVTNDSGPMHLAAAVGTPVVAIFGPTNPNKWRPWAEASRVVTSDECPRRPCYYLSAMPQCDAHDCLGTIGVSEVVGAVDELLAAPGSGQVASGELCDN